MRMLIGISVFLCATLIGYLHYNKYNRILKSNRLLLAFAEALVRNNSREMLSFSELFRKIYNEHFSVDIEISDINSALSYIEGELSNAVGFADIITIIKEYINAGGTELAETQKRLLEKTDECNKQAEKLLKENGGSSLALFPSISLIALILLI